MFEYSEFLSNLQAECTPSKISLEKKEDLLAMCSADISFVRHRDQAEDTPCWIEVVAQKAYKLTTGTSYSSLVLRYLILQSCQSPHSPLLRILDV